MILNEQVQKASPQLCPKLNPQFKEAGHEFFCSLKFDNFRHHKKSENYISYY